MKNTRHSTAKVNGFTLIEMLITMSLFSILMVTLMGSLFASTHAWRKVDTSIVRTAKLERVLNQWVWELEHLYFEVDNKNPVFVLGLDEQGQPMMTYLTCDPWLQNGIAGGLRQVTWQLETSDLGTALVQVSQDQVAGFATRDKQRLTLIQNISKLSIQCLKNGQWVDNWQDLAVPQAICIKIQISKTPRVLRWETALPLLGGNK